YTYNYLDTEDLDGSDEQLADSVSSRPDKLAENDDMKKNVLSALNNLKPYLREVVILKHYQQFKFREIAEITNTSVGTLKARFHKAVKELNEHLRKTELQNVS
ncbi:MAG: RNA polymerase sigma factor, partial [Rhodothermaceae bacterium]